MTKRFTAIILIANIIMGLLIYFSSQSVLLNLVGVQGNYTGVREVNFWSIYVGAVSVGGSPIPLVVYGIPNTPSIAFIFALMVNACLMVKLLTSKETEQNSSENNSKP